MLTHKFPKHLKIAALKSSNHIKPFALQSNEGNVSYFLDAFVIPLLSQAFGFTYEVLTPADGSFGSITPSGNWTGLIGTVQSGQADIAVGIMISENRNKALNFTTPYVFTDVTFVTDNPVSVQKSFAIFYPFSPWVWITLALFLLSVTFLTYIFVSKRYNSTVILIDLFGILLQNAPGIKVRTRSTKILIFSWIIGTLFLAHCYKAVLLAFLSFPSMTGIYDVKGLSEASKKPSFHCRTMPGSYLYNVLMNATDELYGPIGKCVRRNSRDTRSNKDFLAEPNVHKALMSTRRVLTQFHLTHFLSKDSFFPSPIGIPVGKTFCCKKELDKVIRRLFDSGILQKLTNDVFYFSSFIHASFSVFEDASSNEKLSLSDFSGAFIVLTAGLIFATVVLVLEVIIYRIKRHKKKLYGG